MDYRNMDMSIYSTSPDWESTLSPADIERNRKMAEEEREAAEQLARATSRWILEFPDICDSCHVNLFDLSKTLSDSNSQVSQCSF